jgi:L-threonylcarbamoyladenylate synthase
MSREPYVTRRLIVHPRHPDPAVIDEAGRVLAAGGLVAFPTETVYGLGADAMSEEAVAGIFRAKDRPTTDPLIVHLASASRLATVAAAIPPAAQALADRFWPGPLTVIVPRKDTVPALVAAGRDTVAVRVPAHPVAHAVLVAAARPIAAPSANRFSRPSPTTAAHVLADLDGRIDLVVDAGPTDIGVESTIVDCTGAVPVIRRAGGVPAEAIVAALSAVRIETSSTATLDAAQVAPGQLLRHYAPQAPLTVVDGAREAVVTRIGREARDRTARGERVGVLAPDEILAALAPVLAAPASSGRVVVESLGAWAEASAAARVLFAALRRLDEAGATVLLAAPPTREGLGAAVWDRLRRAAEGRVIQV